MPEELKIVDNKTYIELKYGQRDLDNFKPYSYNQKKIRIENDDPFEDGILLYLANLNTMDDSSINNPKKTFKNEISLHLMPNSISEIYSYNIVSQSPYASMRPYYFYTSGSEKQISFTFQLHTDMLDTVEREEGQYFGRDIIYKDLDVDYGEYKELYTILQNYPIINMILNMSRPIYRYNNNTPELHEPLVYFQLGNQFAGIGYLNSSFKFSKPYDVETGTYKMINISMTITYMEEFDIYSQYQTGLITMGQEESWYRTSYEDENTGYANKIAEIAKDLGVIKLEETQKDITVDNFLIDYFEKGNIIQNVMTTERLQKLFNVENIMLFGPESGIAHFDKNTELAKKAIQDNIYNLEEKYVSEELLKKYKKQGTIMSEFHKELYETTIEYLNLLAGVNVYESANKRKAKFKNNEKRIRALIEKLERFSTLCYFLVYNPLSSSIYVADPTKNVCGLFYTPTKLNYSLDFLLKSIKKKLITGAGRKFLSTNHLKIQFNYKFNINTLRRFYNFMTAGKTGIIYTTNAEFLNFIKQQTKGTVENQLVVLSHSGQKRFYSLDEDIEFTIDTSFLESAANLETTTEEYNYFSEKDKKYCDTRVGFIRMNVGHKDNEDNKLLFFLDNNKTDKFNNKPVTEEFIVGGYNTLIYLSLYYFILMDYTYFGGDYSGYSEQRINAIYEAIYNGYLGQYIQKSFSSKALIEDRWLLYTGGTAVVCRKINQDEYEEILGLLNDLESRIELALRIYMNIYTEGSESS